MELNSTLKKLFLITASAFLLSACSGNNQDHSDHSGGDVSQEEAQSDSQHENEHESNNHNKTEGQGNYQQFAEPPKELNNNATSGLLTLQTKNITRLNTEDKIEASILTAQTIWPSTHKENQPGAVILAPRDNWQVALAAADLIHHPNDGPLLFYGDDGVDEKTLQEIRRLNPTGNMNDVQVIIMGSANEEVLNDLERYKIEQIRATDPSQFANELDQYYATQTGELPKSVIIVSQEDEAKLYSLIAVNWIAHMPEPILYVSKDGIPEATVEALTKREGEASIYILGPEEVISEGVHKQLEEFGNVTRIAGKGAVETAAEFAGFKDEKTGFGWGIKSPGHGIAFISSETPELALAAAPFSHLGKHAPLLWLQKGELTEPLYKFLAQIRPTFTNEPQEGPYNHGFIVGTMEKIPFTSQGIIDEKLEITSVNGEHSH